MVNKYKIFYSGWTAVEVEASSEAEAHRMFWDHDLHELYDPEITSIDLVELSKSQRGADE